MDTLHRCPWAGNDPDYIAYHDTEWGVPVGIAWGDPLNFKITTPGDLMLAEALCARR